MPRPEPPFRGRRRALNREVALMTWLRRSIFCLLAASVLVCAATATAGVPSSSGGVGGCGHYHFGSRTLALGDCGGDVATLNWLLRAKASRSVGLGSIYDASTVAAVRDFERANGLRPNGVFEESTRQSLTGSLPFERASWYGGRLNGRQTACGQTLRRTTVGVANKTLPCGTKVVFGYQGHWLRTQVIDRGPYVKHRDWDLTEAAADRLDFTGAGVGDLQVAVLPGYSAGP
jgi:rare lipoprotein A (RlpA)-like double-psi beta-barrel protein/putative peptidoglycan binding protein